MEVGVELLEFTAEITITHGTNRINDDRNNYSQIFPEAILLWAMPHLILPQPYAGPVFISISR